MTPEPTPQGEPGSDRVERWTIYVCPECGQHGFKFGTEHGIPLACDWGSEHDYEHHGFPPEHVEVVRRSSYDALAERLRGVADELEKRVKATRRNEHLYLVWGGAGYRMKALREAASLVRKALASPKEEPSE